MIEVANLTFTLKKFYQQLWPINWTFQDSQEVEFQDHTWMLPYVGHMTVVIFLELGSLADHRVFNALTGVQVQKFSIRILEHEL